MKTTMLWLLITTLFLSLCGCKTPSKGLETADPLPSFSEAGKQDATGSGKTVVFESVENDREATVTFYDQDLSALPLRMPTNYTAEYAPSPSCYSELMKELADENGLIVSGYAYGLRTGYKEDGLNPHTKTTFKVEKVYFGHLEQDIITVLENYYPVSENGEEYIEYDNAKTMLKDNRKSLLFLVPANTAGLYCPCYGELPLPEDYQVLADAERKELFDFYRGDRSLFNVDLVGPLEDYTETVHNPDGSVNYVEYEGFDRFWPEREISEEALLEELNENVLLQMVAKYNIKIWPYYHIRYTCGDLRFGGAIGRDSLPR